MKILGIDPGVACTGFGLIKVVNNNLEVIEEQTYKSKKQKLSQENFLINEGTLIKLSNGVTLKRDADLIIVQQSSKTIIFSINDAQEIIAFLEN